MNQLAHGAPLHHCHVPVTRWPPSLRWALPILPEPATKLSAGPNTAVASASSMCPANQLGPVPIITAQPAAPSASASSAITSHAAGNDSPCPPSVGGTNSFPRRCARNCVTTAGSSRLAAAPSAAWVRAAARTSSISRGWRRAVIAP